MAGSGPAQLDFLTVDDVLRLHSFIVEGDEHTEPGVSDRGAIEYATGFVSDGHFGERPETIHDAAFQLMRLLVANHPFVDGNKRTALLSVVAFYAVNGWEFDYDRDVKATLKALATDEQSVDQAETVEQFVANTTRHQGSAGPGDDSIEQVLRREFRRRRYNAEDDQGDQ